MHMIALQQLQRHQQGSRRNMQSMCSRPSVSVPGPAGRPAAAPAPPLSGLRSRKAVLRQTVVHASEPSAEPALHPAGGPAGGLQETWAQLRPALLGGLELEAGARMRAAGARQPRTCWQRQHAGAAAQAAVAGARAIPDHVPHVAVALPLHTRLSAACWRSALQPAGCHSSAAQQAVQPAQAAACPDPLQAAGHSQAPVSRHRPPSRGLPDNHTLSYQQIARLESEPARGQPHPAERAWRTTTSQPAPPDPSLDPADPVTLRPSKPARACRAHSWQRACMSWQALGWGSACSGRAPACTRPCHAAAYSASARPSVSVSTLPSCTAALA